MERKRLFHTLAWLIIFIFLANGAANKFYWYSSIWYFDIIMHFFGGFWVGIFALYLGGHPQISSKLVWRILLTVLIIGLGWEIFEIIVDKVISRNAFNLLDSSADIFFDSAGGAAAVIYYLKNFGQNQR